MVVYRLANEADNQQLLDLTSASGMSGETGLRIDRHPDFFSLLKQRGSSKTFVAERDGIIIGSLCISTNEVYVDGEKVPVGYIGDFKVAELFRRSGIGMQLTEHLHRYVVEADSDLMVLTVAHGNDKPLSFFKNRPGVPDFQSIGQFNVYQFIGRSDARVTESRCEEVVPTDEVIQFMDNHFRGYQLGPVITPTQLKNGKTFIIREKGNIVGAMTLSDMMMAKQNVVTSLPLSLRLGLVAINGIGKWVEWSRMPELNKPIGMLYIRFLAVANHHRETVKALLRRAQHEAWLKSYSFVSIGVHEKDPLNKSLRNLFKLTFRSAGMLTSLKNNENLVRRIIAGIPFEDYSLV